MIRNKIPISVFSVLIFVLVLLMALPPAFASRTFKRVKMKATDGSERQVELYGASHALLVAVSDYTKGWSKLESVPGEMDQLENLLNAKGFQVTRVDDPTGKELEQAYENFIDNYGYNPRNRLLFFYSGHGHTRLDGSKGYLVPVDAPDPDRKEKPFLRKALPMTQVLAWARDIEAKHVLFLFDSCFSGTVFKQKNKATPSKYISTLSAKPVRQFITAGSANEPVPARSTFTPAFIDALQYGLADRNKDSYITGSELGAYLQEEVPLHTNQNPQYGKISDYDLSRGDFIFLAGGNPDDQISDAINNHKKDAPPASIRYGRRVALVVGNSSYKSAPLKNPRNDADDMSTILEKSKFKVTKLLDANQKEFQKAIDHFVEEVKVGGVGLFYYSGHGLHVDGVDYLIPLDAEMHSVEDVKYTSINLEQVIAMSKSNKRKNNSSNIISYSTQQGALAMDGPGRNGIYTQFLLENMSKPGLEIHDLLRRVKRSVKKESLVRQIPVETSTFTDKFYFTPNEDNIVDGSLLIFIIDTARVNPFRATY